MKKKSYIVVSFVILIFGIWALPKIIGNFSKEKLIKFEQVPAFKFINQDNISISNENYKNKVYVIEFFFTSCPTICPIMNASMLKLQNEFYGNPDFGMASFSIDPKRDTPGVLKAYATKNGITLKNWNLLTGKKDDIYALSHDGFKLYVGENKEAEGGFEHSGLFALIDKQGFIRSRTVKNGEQTNPIKYYNGLDDKEVQWLKEDIAILLKE